MISLHSRFRPLRLRFFRFGSVSSSNDEHADCSSSFGFIPEISCDGSDGSETV